MAEHAEETTPVARETPSEKIVEEFHDQDSSASFSDPDDDDDDDDDKKSKPSTAPGKPKIFRLFGREKPVHKVLGGGKPADVLLWRDKKISGGVLGGATAIWVLFELLDYHLLLLVCRCLILSLVILFLWSNASTFINKTPPRIPTVSIPEDAVVDTARALCYEINQAFTVLREIALGRDLKKFLAAVAGLWFLSVLGSCCDFLTLFYIVFVMLHTVPVLYEKYEDKVDSFAEKAIAEIKKQYLVFDAKVLSKIPRATPAKNKKHS